MAETYPKIVPLSSDIRPRVSGTNSVGTTTKPFSEMHSHSLFVSGVGFYTISQIPTTGNLPNAPSGSMGLSSDGSGVYYFGNNPISGTWNQFVTSDANGNYNITLNDPRLSPTQVIRVQQNPGSGQFASIYGALQSISGLPSASTPYVVFIEPGSYIEPELNVDPYIYLVGRDQAAVSIAPSGVHNVFNLSTNTSLSFLSINDAPTGFYGADAINPGDYVLLHKVSFVNCDIGMRAFSDNGATDNAVYLEYVDSTNNNSTTAGFHFENQGVGTLDVAVENFYTYGDITNPTYGVHMVGEGLTLATKASALQGADGLGYGIVVESGASLVAGVLGVSNWATGVYAPQDALAPNVILNSTPFAGNTDYNIYLENSGTTGYMVAYTDIDKQYINENNQFFMTYRKDHTITVSKKGGDFTSISNAINYINTNPDPATIDHGYLIIVGPGMYLEPELFVPEFVYIQGEDQYAVTIAPSGNSNLFNIGQSTTLSFLTIQDVPSGYYGVVSTNPGDFTLMHKVAFENCWSAAKIVADSGTINSFYFEYVDTTQDGTSGPGFEFISVSGAPLDISCENWYTIAGASNPLVGVVASGSGLTLATRASALIGVDQTGYGLHIMDGAHVSLPVLGISNWATGIYVPQDSGAPDLRAYAVAFTNNGINYAIENSGTSGFSNSFSPYLKNEINIDSSFFLANKDQRVVVVAKKGGDFDSVNDALVAITPLVSPTSIYTIQINPGIYDEPAMTIPSHTQVKGDNMEGVIIRPTGDYNLFTLSEDANMEFMTLFGNGFSTTSSAIYGDNIGSYTTLHKVYIDDFNKGITVLNSSSGVTSYLYLEYTSVQTQNVGQPEYALSMSSDQGGSTILAVDAQNFTVYGYDQNPTDAIIAQGQDVSFSCKVVNMEGWNSSGNAVTVFNGAKISLGDINISLFGTGLSGPNTGTAPNVTVSAINFQDCGVTIDLVHPTTIGSLNGVGNSVGAQLVSPNLTASFLDPVNKTNGQMGNLYLGNEFSKLQFMSPAISNSTTMGLISGGELVALPPASGLVIHVSGGQGYVDVNVNDWTATKYVSWATQPYSGIVSNDDVYIYVDENGVIGKSTNSINGQVDKILLGRAVCNPIFVSFIEETSMEATHFSNKADEYLRDVFGSIVADGLVISSGTGLSLNMTGGEYYYSSHLWEPDAKAPIPSWLEFYHSGSVWVSSVNSSGIANNTQYDNGANLTGLTTSYYGKAALWYAGSSDTMLYVYPGAEYSGLTQVQAATSPTPPPSFKDATVHLADLILQQGSGVWIQIDDTRPVPSYKATSQVGGGGGVTVHNQLLGLGADDHTQYLLANGSRPLGGNWDLGGYNLTTVGTINSVQITGHASRHDPNSGTDPVTTAAPTATFGPDSANSVGIQNSLARSDHGHAFAVDAPVTITGLTNSSGSANSFSRSDHVHAHGAQSDATLHAAASAVANGFMSSGNFTALAGKVNSSGDTMTGNLTLSGTSLLAFSSNTSNIGSSATPFGTVYASELSGVNARGYVNAYSTGSQTITAGATFQNVTFSHSPYKDNWSHTSGTATFTCNLTGYYRVDYNATINRLTTPAQTVELRTTLNGTEIPGSQAAAALSANTIPQIVSNSFILPISSGNTIVMQAATNTANAANIFSAGTTATTRPSIRLSINKL